MGRAKHTPADRVAVALRAIQRLAAADMPDVARLSIPAFIRRPPAEMHAAYDTLAVRALALPCLSRTAADNERSKVRRAILSSSARRATLCPKGRAPVDPEGGRMVTRSVAVPVALDIALDELPDAPRAMRGALARLVGMDPPDG